jgi:hypothetical protein
MPGELFPEILTKKDIVARLLNDEEYEAEAAKARQEPPEPIGYRWPHSRIARLRVDSRRPSRSSYHHSGPGSVLR